MKSIEEIVNNNFFFFFFVQERNVPLLREDIYDADRRTLMLCTHLVHNIDGLNIKNSDELLEILTPFFYYLVSTYLRKNGNCKIFTAVDVYFHHRYSHLFNHNHLRIMHFWVKKCVTDSFMSESALECTNGIKKLY